MKEHVVSVFRSQTPRWAEKFYMEKRGTPMRPRAFTKNANKIWKQDTVKYSEIINTWLQFTQGKIWKMYIINRKIGYTKDQKYGQDYPEAWYDWISLPFFIPLFSDFKVTHTELQSISEC